jgi:hypothetical protein
VGDDGVPSLAHAQAEGAGLRGVVGADSSEGTRKAMRMMEMMGIRRESWIWLRCSLRRRGSVPSGACSGIYMGRGQGVREGVSGQTGAVQRRLCGVMGKR